MIPPSRLVTHNSPVKTSGVIRLRVWCLGVAHILAAINLVTADSVISPRISWVPNQQFKDGVNFPQKVVYFLVWDDKTVFAADDINVDVQNDPDFPMFYSKGRIQIDECVDGDGGCPTDGTGFKMTLLPV